MEEKNRTYTHPVSDAFRRYADAMRAHASIQMPDDSRKDTDRAVAQVLVIEFGRAMDSAGGDWERDAIAAVAREWCAKAGLSRKLFRRPKKQ
jgi:hypothetical protein